jgi:hypothetical protein
VDLKREDAIAHRAGGDRHAAKKRGLECGKASDLLQQDGAKDGGQRQVVRPVLAEAGEHSLQDLRDLA